MDQPQQRPGKLKYLPVNKIKEPQDALRTVNNKDLKYLEFVDSIKSKGILVPITVREVKDDPEYDYALIDGRHRLVGARDAGLQEIPAQILSMDEIAVIEAQIIANLQKIETKPAEYAAALQRLFLQNPTLTKRQLAQKVNKSTTWVDKVLSLNELPDRVKALLDSGEIVVSNAYSLANLAAKSPDEVENYIDAAQNESPGDFGPKIDARVRQIKVDQRQGRDPTQRNVYTPEPFLRKKHELVQEMQSPKFGPQLIQQYNLQTALDGWNMAIKFALRRDPIADEEGQRAWEIARRKQLDEKAKRSEENSRKRAEDAQRRLQDVAV